MKQTKFFIAFIFLPAFAVCGAAQQSKVKLRIKAKDKTEIVKQVFAEGFEKLISDEKLAQCTIPIVNDEKIILIYTNESKIYPESFGEYRFRFMSGKEIEAEVKSNNGDCYLQINRLNFESQMKAKVTLWRWIRVITVSSGKSLYPAGWVGATGLVYEVTKKNGKWQVKFLNETAIVS